MDMIQQIDLTEEMKMISEDGDDGFLVIDLSVGDFSYSSIQSTSKALKRFLLQDSTLSLLPDCGWLDGGCRSLMKAFMLCFDFDVEPYMIVQDPNHLHAEHALIKIGDYFLDGDGVSTEEQLIYKWKNDIGLAQVFLKPFNPLQEPSSETEEPYYIHDESIHELARALDHTFDQDCLQQLLNTDVKEVHGHAATHA